MANDSPVRALAHCFVRCEPNVDQLVAQSTLVLGHPWPWLTPLAKRYVDFTAGKVRPRFRDVLLFFRFDRGFRQALARHSKQLVVERWPLLSAPMLPVPAAELWNLPAIQTIGALAEWLTIVPGELEWFADLKTLCGKTKADSKLKHYTYRILHKSSGSVRLIEMPKSRLKRLQRLILADILQQIPPHPAAHGFIKKHSIQTYCSPHVAQRVILRMDLRDFFANISGVRVQSAFRTLGYPEAVADLLGGLCTTSAPGELWRNKSPELQSETQLRIRSEARELYRRRHLPQGAPTSPALANICSYRIDCRLNGLAQAAGATYTRYADDLAFSGGREFERSVERFSLHAAAILLEEGFHVQHRKTRIMRTGVRQHLAGLVLNERLNTTRADFDLLKATLTNCIRHGPGSQNREGHADFRAHLAGRVAFAYSVNPVKGQRLRNLFSRISWS